MASLNASGVSVVPKQNVGWRSYGRNIAVTSGSNPYGQDSISLAVVEGVPAYARASVDFGTQSTPVVDSFLREGGLVKHAESVDDTVVARILAEVPITSGNQPEVALKPITQRSVNHNNNKLVIRESERDGLVSREDNQGFTPGP